MTKQEAKEAFGKRAESKVRMERRYVSGTIHDSNRWVSVPNPVRGVFIGVRAYWDGQYIVESGIQYFKQTEIVTVALIVPGWRNKPVPVPLGECEVVKGGE